jgi:hypothetical protein
MEKSMFKYSIDSIINSVAVIDNKLPVCEFFDNVLLGKPYAINVLVFTIEGEPQIRMFEYDGKVIDYTLDATKTSTSAIRYYNGNRFVKEIKGAQIYYDLYKDNQFITTLLSYRN